MEATAEAGVAAAGTAAVVVAVTVPAVKWPPAEAPEVSVEAAEAVVAVAAPPTKDATPSKATILPVFTTEKMLPLMTPKINLMVLLRLR